MQRRLSEKVSESDRHRQKRANVQAGQLQQKVSALMGRPLNEAELRTIFPSFSAQMPGSGGALPGSAFSGQRPAYAYLHYSLSCAYTVPWSALP